ASWAVVSLPLCVLDPGGWFLLTNAEARSPAMARDIVTRGHWLAPAIAGTPMLNKPPLHAWLIALASLPGGEVTPRTAAIPSMIGGSGGGLGAPWLGWEVFWGARGLSAGVGGGPAGGVFAPSLVPLPVTTVALRLTAARFP